MGDDRQIPTLGEVAQLYFLDYPGADDHLVASIRKGVWVAVQPPDFYRRLAARLRAKTRRRGGDWGHRKRRELVNELETFADKLDGRLTAPVTQAGMFDKVIRLPDRGA